MKLDYPVVKILAAPPEDVDETLFTLQLNEAQVTDLAAGRVPRLVRAMCSGCLDLLDGEDRAGLATTKPKRKRKAAA